MNYSSTRPRYLHPNYNYLYEHEQPQKLQLKKYNNSASARTDYNNCFTSTPQQYRPPITMSPLGLKEVLSSYTPGPTVIMIEKKRKPSLFENKNVRIAGIFLAVLLCYMAGSSLHSAGGEKSFLELKSQPVSPQTEQGREEALKSLDPPTPHGQNDDNLSGYTYLNTHFKYSSVILSLDDDDESHVEDIQSYIL